MLTRPQLVKQRDWLGHIHSAKSRKSVQKVLETGGLAQLRLLIKLIYDVALDKIRLTAKKNISKLFQYKSEIRSITGNIKNLLKQEESVLKSLLAPLIPVLKIFVSPLFEIPSQSPLECDGLESST